MRMKKNVLVLLVVFSSSLFTFCKAQFNVYHPFPDSNAAWGETSYWLCMTCNPIDVGHNEFDYYVRGDTVVNGKTYSKLNISGGIEYDDLGSTVYQCYNYLFCLLRNDTLSRKVYASFKPNYGKDTLLYDFNLKVGDTLPMSYSNISNNFFVCSIDSILVGSTYRKQFIISQDSVSIYWAFDSITEGIGSWLGLMEDIYPPFEGGCNINCFEDSTIVFPAGGCTIFHTCPESAIHAIGKPQTTISVYPSPSAGVFTMRSSVVSGKWSVEVYNILGENVYSTNYLPPTNHYSLDLSAQPDGIYLYRVIANSGELIGEGKLVIQK